MPPGDDSGGPAGGPPGDGPKRSGLRGVPSRTLLLAAVGVVLAGVWVLSGLGVINATFLFPGADDATRLVVADKLGDCREARLDTGEGCEPGADIESVSVWWPDLNTLAVELELTEAPGLGEGSEGSEWTAEFFAETANAFTDGGLICGLSNAGAGPAGSSAAASPDSPELVAYAARNRFTEERLGPEACDASLQGTSVRFTIDVTGQPETDELRLIGTVRLEYPDDLTRPGSDDDFLVRTSLFELR